MFYFIVNNDMLNELLLASKAGFCFVENHNNDAIPMIDCYFDNKLDPKFVHGKDFLNQIDVSIKIEDIKSYMHVESNQHKLYKRFELHFRKLRDICAVENISYDNEFFYKRLPIFEKIISLILNKNYNDISLSELKNLWISYIEKYCNNFDDYINSELNESSNDLYKNELLNIKNDLKEIKKYKEIKKFKNKEDLAKFWPTLLMPAPSFVDL